MKGSNRMVPFLDLWTDLLTILVSMARQTEYGVVTAKQEIRGLQGARTAREHVVFTRTLWLMVAGERPVKGSRRKRALITACDAFEGDSMAKTSSGRLIILVPLSRVFSARPAPSPISRGPVQCLAVGRSLIPCIHHSCAHEHQIHLIWPSVAILRRRCKAQCTIVKKDRCHRVRYVQSKHLSSLVHHPSSITSSAASASLTVSSSFLILLTLFGDTSRATASSCADLTSSPSSRYTFAS